MFIFINTSWRELTETIVNHETNREENKTMSILFLRMIRKYHSKQAQERKRERAQSESNELGIVSKRDTIEKQAQAVKQAIRKTGTA